MKLIKTFLPFDNNLLTTMERIKRITKTRSKIDLKKFCPNHECQQIVTEATCVKRDCKNFNKTIQPDLFHCIYKKSIKKFYSSISVIYLNGDIISPRYI